MIRLSAAVLLSSAAYTAFMAALAWEALRLSGRAGGPASVFALSAFTALCAAPVLGVWVDRLGPRRAMIASQLAVTTVLTAAAASRSLGWGETLYGLLVLAGLHGVAAAMTNPAMHGLVQSYSTPETATSMASRNGLSVALGFIVGYAAGGVLLDAWGFVATLSICAATSLVVSGLSASLRQQQSPASGIQKPTKSWQEFRLGLRYLFGDPQLRDAAVAYILCYSVFHSVTALLPPFSKFVLSGDAPQFGFLRAAWSVGSAVGALGLSLFWGRRRAGHSAKFAAVAGLGLLFSVFGAARTFDSAVILIALVGISHASCRSFLDGYLLQLCDRQMIGRVRGLVNSLISAVSLVVFLAASGVRASWIGTIFTVLGLSVSAASGAIYLRRSLSPLADAPRDVI